MENLAGTWSWKSFRRSVKNKSELPAREQIIPDQSTLRYVINFQRYINCKSLRLTKFFHSATIISKRFDSYRSVLLTLRMQSIIWVISCLDRFPSVIGWEISGHFLTSRSVWKGPPSFFQFFSIFPEKQKRRIVGYEFRKHMQCALYRITPLCFSHVLKLCWVIVNSYLRKLPVMLNIDFSTQFYH